MNLPIAYDYATESAIFGTRILSLTPEGREIVGELAWTGQLWGGAAGASLFYRREPGHFAKRIDGTSQDAGIAVKWSKGF